MQLSNYTISQVPLINSINVTAKKLSTSKSFTACSYTHFISHKSKSFKAITYGNTIMHTKMSKSTMEKK